MGIVKEILANSVLWTAISAWLAAQIIKFILVFVTTKSVDLKRLVGSGGMPSSHSAIVSALAVSVGLTDGFASAEFAICTITAFVVMYDASGVRRAAGQHARILNGIIRGTENFESGGKLLKELLGHSPLEVFAGAVLGTLIAVLANYLK